jgi:RNA polymerase sigma-70 factor (ECF subfamily)
MREITLGSDGEEAGLRFQTTSWSVLRRAAGPSTDAREALSRLCEAYWPPVYALIRRRGHAPADAEDLTQSYFARFLEKGYLHDFRPEAGRFRTFLRASVGHFLANEWDRDRALKRGGGRVLLSLDAATAEERLRLEPVDRLTPETVFERQWAAAVLARCLERLRREQAAGGGAGRFERLKAFLASDGAEAGYAELARDLGIGEPAVRVAVHRLRQRLAAVLREEVLETVSDPREVDEEIRWLLEAVRGRG